MTPSTLVRSADPALRAALRLAAAFAAAKLLLTFALTLYTLHIGYGYFRDEFYYIACGHHLAWGFVDHGPIVALQARLGEILFGDSVFGIRVLAAVAGAATVFLTGILGWAMGGNRPAQALAMFGILCAPHYIGVDGILSMNCYEPVFWMLCALSLFLMQRGHSYKLWWVVLGISAGVGTLNKPSMGFFLVALTVGLLCTATRRVLWSPWAALGIVLMFAIVAPYLLWQIHNGWPTLEFLRNGQLSHKNVIMGPVQFFLAQFAMLGPVNGLLWMPGTVALLRAKSIQPGNGQTGRWFGITYLCFYTIMFAMHAKDYYLEGVYPALFAAGAVAWERRYALSRRVMEERLIAFPVYESVLLATSLLILPMASPVLKPATWVAYTKALHLRGDRQETDETAELPQFFADRFGWGQEVSLVVQAYRSLTPEEQRRVCLFTGNYGEAGAIDLLGRRQVPGLPPAISGQNSYWMWGTHGCDVNLVIAVIGDSPGAVGRKYETVQVVGRMGDPYAMPSEHKRVYVLRRRRADAPFDWADEKDYI